MDTKLNAARLIELAGSETFLEGLSDAVTLIDAATMRIAYRNPESKRIAARTEMPYAGTEMAGRLGFLWPDGTPLTPEEIPGVSAIQQGEHVLGQLISITCLDGSIINLSLDSAPLRDETTAIAGAILIFREVGVGSDQYPRLTEEIVVNADRTRRFHALLYEATRDISDAEKIAEITTELVGLHLHVNRCSYATVDVEADLVQTYRGYIDDVPNNAGTYRLSQFGQRLMERQKAGVTEVINDTSVDPLTKESFSDTYAVMETRALIRVPLIRSARLVGFFTVHQREPRQWTQSEVRLVEEVASRTWSTIERINVQQALEASEARFRTLVEGIPQLTWTSTPNGERDYHSPQWLAYTGRKQEDSLGYQWLEAIHPGDREQFEASWRKAVSQHDPFEIGFQLRRFDGAYRYFHARALPVFDSHGSLIKWMGATTDVHDLLMNQRALEAQVEQQRLVADAAYHITHTGSMEEILRFATEEARIALGARAVLVRLHHDEGGLANWAGSLDDGRFLWSTVGSMPRIERLVEDAVQGYHALQIDMADEALHDKLESLGLGDMALPGAPLALIAPLIGNDGTRLGVIICCPRQGPSGDGGEELTSGNGPVLVQFAQVLSSAIENLRLTRDLEMRVKERTALLLQKVEELEGFSYMVSHDLRAPLRSIVGNARLVLMDEGDRVSSEGKDMLKRLASSSMTMSQLVDDLLEYARLGAKEPRFEDVRVAALAAQVSRDVNADYPQANIHIRIDDDVKIVCDPRLIGLVVQNLLENSCKYVAKNQNPEIEIGIDDGAIYVRDQGIGFNMAYADKLFQPFSRLHASKDYVGTGIGLANVRRILDRHSGQIWVESAEGVGSTFRFTVGDHSAQMAYGAA